MTIKPTHNFPLRLPMHELAHYQKLVYEKKFSSVNKAIIECGCYGRILLSYKDVFDDPQRRKEFFEKANSMMNEKHIFEWVKALPDTEFQGFASAIKMRKKGEI